MSERIEKILARELNEPRSRVKTLLQKGQTCLSIAYTDGELGILITKK